MYQKMLKDFFPILYYQCLFFHLLQYFGIFSLDCLLHLFSSRCLRIFQFRGISTLSNKTTMNNILLTIGFSLIKFQLVLLFLVRFEGYYTLLIRFHTLLIQTWRKVVITTFTNLIYVIINFYPKVLWLHASIRKKYEGR